MILVVGYFASQSKKEQQKKLCWANIEAKINTVNDLDSLLKY